MFAANFPVFLFRLTPLYFDVELWCGLVFLVFWAGVHILRFDRRLFRPSWSMWSTTIGFAGFIIALCMWIVLFAENPDLLCGPEPIIRFVEGQGGQGPDVAGNQRDLPLAGTDLQSDPAVFFQAGRQ